MPFFLSWIDTEERTIKRTVSLFREMVGNLIGRAATLPRARVYVQKCTAPCTIIDRIEMRAGTKAG